MSKTKTKKRQPVYRRPIFWVIFLILVLVVVAIAFVLTARQPLAHPSDSSNPTPESSTPVAETSPSDEPDTTPTPAPDQPADKVIQYEGDNPNSLSELTGAIVYHGVENGNLVVQVAIDQYLAHGGTCTLTLTGKTHGGSYTTTNPAFADISTSACQDFTVPLANLPSDTYELKIQLSNDAKTGSISEEIKL